MMLVYLAIVGAVIWLVLRLPTSFLPNEDQGYIIVNVQLPPGATANRALAVMEQVEGFMLKQPEVQEHGQRARLQLLGPGAERGAGLRHAEGLGRARRRRSIRRRRWPAAPSAR